MPAFPKIIDVNRFIRRVEVHCDINIHHLTDNGSHIGVATEIEIDLERIGKHNKDRIDCSKP